MKDYRDQIRQSQSSVGSPAKGKFAIDSSALKVLRNTYMLLSASLAFSAACAYISMVLRVPYIGLWMLLPYFFCLWMVERNKNNSSGIFWVFALTGFLGVTLGPIISYYIAAKGGAEIVLMALAGTGAIFFAASTYITTTGKNVTGWAGFLVIGLLIAFIAAIANIFLQIEGMSLAISCIFLVICSALIMVQISSIIHGGERNYISATVMLFVMLFNIFTSLLHILGVANDD